MNLPWSSIAAYVTGNIMDTIVTVVARANGFMELNPLLKNDYWVLVKFSLAALFFVLLLKRPVILKLVGITLMVIAGVMMGWLGIINLLESGRSSI